MISVVFVCEDARGFRRPGGGIGRHKGLKIPRQ